MTRRLCLFALSLSIAIAGYAQTTTSPQASLNVTVDAKSSGLPPAAKFAFSVQIRYCIGPGLQDAPIPTRLLGKDTDRVDCSKFVAPGWQNVPANLSDIVAALSAGTEYAVASAGDSILAFCKVKECSHGHDERLKKEILRLALPHPAFFQDVSVPSAQAPELYKAIPGFSKGEVTGRLVSDGVIRLETDQKQKPYETTQLLKQIQNAISNPTVLAKLPPAPSKFAAQRIFLPYFCVSNKLDGPDPTSPQSTVFNPSPKCPDGTELLQANNAADVAKALNSSKVAVTNDNSVSVVINCGGAACDKDAFSALSTSVQTLARPIPAHFQDFDVPPYTASALAARVPGWNTSLTAEVRSNARIRVKSDRPIDTEDLKTLQSNIVQYGFGAPQTQPAWRLFYGNAGAVVSSLAGNPPAPSPFAPGLTAPVTGNPPPEASTAASPASASASSASSSSSSPSTNATTPSSSPAAPASATPAATTPAPAASTSAAAPAPAAPASNPPQNTITSGMVAVGDQVVFTDPLRANASDSDRIQLLTLLDLPRPEVLFNVWSFEESSPDGREVARKSEEIREAVSANNDALQNSIEYGWAFLSRQMQDPSFFDPLFYNYLTQRFVADDPSCAANPSGPKCIPPEKRSRWGLCPAGAYCLGFVEAFQPLHPTLTNILLGIMSAKDPFKAAFTAIGCMEGKYEVYDVCFPEHQAMANILKPPPQRPDNSDDAQCLKKAREKYLNSQPSARQQSCEDLDLAALQAQRLCRLPRAVPLSCFTLQAAKSFMPYPGFSTFSLNRLNELAEKPIADLEPRISPSGTPAFSTTPLGLLRAATVDFLYNYKMAQEFPGRFIPYYLTHSAQELNAEFNPLIVAFNQDVAAFSRDAMDQTQSDIYSHRFGPWHNHRSFIADGAVTVRGISGVESLVDTDTQSSFKAPQFQTLQSALGNLSSLINGATPAASPSAGTTTTTTAQTTNTPGAVASTPNGTTTTTATTAPAPSASTPGFAIPNILSGALTPASVATALAAISPTPANVQIGRQFTIDITPHTLPGASSAELDVKLWAQEDSPPTLYSDNGASSSTDPLSRVARHNVFTRVRVESVKLFDVSSFSAVIQRPRNKIPLVPPLIEIPVIGDVLGLPLPGAKVFHRSTAIVSAIIVPTATDLAYGITFSADRAMLKDGDAFSFHKIVSLDQLPDPLNITGFHNAMVNCLATRGQSAIASLQPTTPCNTLSFDALPPDR
ncbi:MAG: hypothetical protein JO340_19195 [Acidobacteriaceae bacterium]|nr:hypothetical protein [Acidobacteriaceae bacterium]